MALTTSKVKAGGQAPSPLIPYNTLHRLAAEAGANEGLGVTSRLSPEASWLGARPALSSVAGPQDVPLRERVSFPLAPQLQSGADLLLRLRAFAFDPSGEPFRALIDNIDVVVE